ncbi:hypothetical protein [Synechococcus sp. BS55D]|uniref:hypothetical protein n=1 Tax=Synechococcus sp. BS55D TaxID=2055943 RepID=UPI00103F3FB0|nr:hypothetical protein [Synechococcus sp. BS55D]TCD55544.1 hypothetical protein CWE16_09295 [Synechococcus sp. BS55D]
MPRSSSLLWIGLLLLILLPTAAGRVLLDVAGGLLLVLLALPLILGGAGWLGWRLLQSRMQACPACGAMNLSSGESCSVCGSPLTVADPSTDSAPASAMTIDVQAQDVDS